MSAKISEDGLYRYELRRKIVQPIRWVKPVIFCMLNPSTADATLDDPTIRRCIGFADDLFKATELIVVNAFALRATDPRELLKAADPVGPENDAQLASYALHHPVVVAWGAHKAMTKERAKRVYELLGCNTLCLGTTKAGAPRHPLYLPKSVQPVPWSP